MKFSLQKFQNRIHGPVETAAAIVTVVTALIGGIAWIVHSDRSAATADSKPSTTTAPVRSGPSGETGPTTSSSQPDTSTTSLRVPPTTTTTRAVPPTSLTETPALQRVDCTTTSEKDVKQWMLQGPYQAGYMTFQPKTSSTEFGYVDLWFDIPIPAGRTLHLDHPKISYKSATYHPPVTLDLEISFWLNRTTRVPDTNAFSKSPVAVENSNWTTLSMDAISSDLQSGTMMRVRVKNLSTGVPPEASFSVASYGNGFCLLGWLGP